MSFHSAGALLWLVPTGLFLFALYLLKMRRKPLVVPAIFLWPKRTEEVRANALFQRPRLNILFWLQLLALILVVAALARPQFLSRSLTGRVTMILIDGSASMRAADVSPSRFDEAKRLAKQAIDSVGPGDRLGVIVAGQQPRVVFPLSAEPARFVGDLDQLEAEDVACDMGEALRLAAASLTAYEGARILLLSDGAFRPIDEFQLAKGEVVFRSIGNSARNMGISALGSGATAKGKEVYCAVRNHGLDADTADLAIEADGKVLVSQSIRVAPGATWGVTVSVPGDAKLCKASIHTDDHLKSDNTRYCALGEDSRLRILLVGPGDYFLERALVLDPRVTLERSASLPSSEGASNAKPGVYDVIVFSGMPETAVKARGVLTFGAPSGPSAVSGSGAIPRPEFLSAADHPVVRNIEFSGVYVESAFRSTLKSDSRAVLEAREGPLVAVRETPGKRQVHVSFDLQKSDWPLHPGFPIFIGQALTYLAGEGMRDVAAVAAGKPFTVALGSGESLSVPGDVRWSRQEGYAVVRGLPKTGEYSFLVGKNTRLYFANLEDPDEPRIEPAAFIQLGQKKLGKTPIPQRPTDLWRWAALLGLMVLGVEWWVFIRKS